MMDEVEDRTKVEEPIRKVVEIVCTSDEVKLELQSPLNGRILSFSILYPNMESTQSDNNDNGLYDVPMLSSIIFHIEGMYSYYNCLRSIVRKKIGDITLNILSDRTRAVEWLNNFSDLVEENKANVKRLGIWSGCKLSEEMGEQIMKLVTDECIPNHVALNHHYQPFSSETYGETRNAQVKYMMDKLRLGKEDVLFDLGSGIGNVIFYLSLHSQCKYLVGIELAERPASYARDISAKLKDFLEFYSISYVPFELIHGDMLQRDFLNRLKEPTVLYCNNFAFDPVLQVNIQHDILCALDEGVRFLTTKSLSTKRTNKTKDKNVDNFIVVEDFGKIEDSVSWTSNGNAVNFFLHTIMWEKNKRSGSTTTGEETPTSSASSASSTSSSSSSQEMETEEVKEENEAKSEDAVSLTTNDLGQSEQHNAVEVKTFRKINKVQKVQSGKVKKSVSSKHNGNTKVKKEENKENDFTSSSPIDNLMVAHRHTSMDNVKKMSDLLKEKRALEEVERDEEERGCPISKRMHNRRNLGKVLWQIYILNSRRD